jgi:hypothetical protein
MAVEQRNPWTVRSSYLTQAKHINDVFLNLGYDYRGNILKNGTSPELWANPLQTPMYGRLEGMILFLLENVKNIKKHFAFAIDKDNLNIN